MAFPLCIWMVWRRGRMAATRPMVRTAMAARSCSAPMTAFTSPWRATSFWANAWRMRCLPILKVEKRRRHLSLPSRSCCAKRRRLPNPKRLQPMIWRTGAPAGRMTGSGLARQTRRPFFWQGPLLAALLSLTGASAARGAECAVPAGLARFHAAMSAIEAGERARPLTVLHLGDSHISLDNFTRGLRARLQARFGDAGRGLMPGIPFRYYAPDGYTLGMTGPWEVFSSLPADASGAFGIQGFRVEAEARDAVMSLEAALPVSSVEIEAYGGPETGALLLRLGEAAPLRLETRQALPGLVRLRVPAAQVRRITLSPAGT